MSATSLTRSRAGTITISVAVTDPTETRHESSGRSVFLMTIAKLRAKGDMRVDLDGECAFTIVESAGS